MQRLAITLVAVAVTLAACSDPSSDADNEATATTAATVAPDAAGIDDDLGDEATSLEIAAEPRTFGPAPEAPDGPLDPALVDAARVVIAQREIEQRFDANTDEALATIGASGDPRMAWWLTDLLRVTASRETATAIAGAFEALTGVTIEPFTGWPDAVDHLIAWDVPAPPEYLELKRPLYLSIDQRWQPLMPDDSAIDWRLVSWGGVLVDDRPYGETDSPCDCIPAADDPAVTDAATGDEWLEDDTVVFGIEIDGKARAYPRSIMEVREMVNDTLGGRDFAMPYCTLCGSSQVFFTDGADGFERPVMRTSGLLSRSNKVMYDVRTNSVFDTFLGAAVSGPLWEAGVVLPQHSVIVTTWAEWKADHPDTTVLAIEEALGRPDSDLRNTRDADGPIFPIGEVDDRMPVQASVLGVVAPDGTPIAFDAAQARKALEQGDTVSTLGISLVLDGGGLRAVDVDGNDVPSHEAFWFAWSQFHPQTDLWPES
ncbi:MAG: DUF3179 domain-containing (seleno)protein [Acidimicrobiales bacterium]